MRKVISKHNTVTASGREAILSSDSRRETVMVRNYGSLSAIINANKEAGLFWFTKDTMRFFKTKLGKYFGAGVFTTRETDPLGKSGWSIRIATYDGNIETFGEYHTYDKCATASADAKHIAKLLMQGRTLVDSKEIKFKIKE